ncbi:MAG: hypothetical protein Q9218_003627 [Villophora microphyllina]
MSDYHANNPNNLRVDMSREDHSSLNKTFPHTATRDSVRLQRNPGHLNGKRTSAPTSRSLPQSKILPHTDKAGDPYYIGDVYEGSRIRSRDANSNDGRGTPYLDHIDYLTDNGWSNLRYLADFMRVTTSPPMWKFLSQADAVERGSRIKAAMLVIHAHSTERYDITTLEHLERLLQIENKDHHHVIARLFVVEDLSRDLIEALGSHLDVDPTFFSGHISDYIWYNTRDPWIELPSLDAVTRQQSHFNVRYAQTRYFRTLESFKRAREEAAAFNVLRRVDRDGDSSRKDDIYSSVVGLVRSKMSFWVQPQKTQSSDPIVGIVLVDPPITKGFPLWGGYNSLASCPSMTERFVPRASKASVFEDTIYWLEEMTDEEVQSICRDPQALFLKPLSIICSEWILLIRYAKTRFSQLEWEVEDPYLRHRGQGLASTLEKLHTWRRRFPIYKSIVSEILEKSIRREGFLGCTGNTLRTLEKDYQMLLSDLNDLHDRSERMMSVVTAVLSIEESQKALEQNRSLGRLTYLAALFVPLSFISSFFAMSEDISKLKSTFWVYFATAVPVTVLALLATRYSHNLNMIWKRGMHRVGRRLAEDP